MNGVAVSLREVRHQRAGREVLHIATLDVAPGERLALLGPNGAGKTTLLRLVAALEPPSSGAVLIDGAIAHAGGAALRRRIAYAPQRPVLLSTTVANNIELPLRYRRQPRSTRRIAVAEALERLAINHLAARRGSALSGGEAQRVSLARALVTRPALLLLDEPAASLDPSARGDFLADVHTVLTERAVTAIVATHRVEEACALADRIAVLKDGALHQIDTPAELLTHPTDSTVARLVGYENILEAHVTDDGTVRIAGQPTGLATHPQSRPLTVATWAAGIRVHPISTPGVRARVRSSTPGPGRWELQLDAAQPIHAHLPLTANRPTTGDTVAVTLDPAQTVALGIATRSTAPLQPSVPAELPAPARRR